MQDAAYVDQAFRGIAPRYVLANHVLSLGIDVLWRRKVARAVRRAGPASVLDLATGSGDLAVAVRDACPGAWVVGADFCQPMMVHARRRGLGDLVVADGMCLPFADRAFDVVTIGFGLRNMASWDGAATEMARVMRPGGHLFVLDFARPGSAPVRWLYQIYLGHVVPLVGGLLTGRRDAYEYLCSSIGSFPCGPDMVALLDRCGFNETCWEPLTGGVAALYTATRAG
jgi:demethylmenaquinone methyltransferase/2-methoxy-6-polyprenyl-1,4-benzoquinol methylase